MTQAVATGIWTGPIGFVPVSAWAGSPGAVFEIKTGPTDYAILTEVLIYVGALGSGPTAQLTLGFGKSASAGTLVNPTAVSSLDGSRTDAASGVTYGTQWSVYPTAPTNYLRRYTSPGTTYFSRIKWHFSHGLKVAPSSSWSAWIITSGATSYALHAELELDL
jgi:hypothetical protein